VPRPRRQINANLERACHRPDRTQAQCVEVAPFDPGHGHIRDPRDLGDIDPAQAAADADCTEDGPDPVVEHPGMVNVTAYLRIVGAVGGRTFLAIGGSVQNARSICCVGNAPMWMATSGGATTEIQLWTSAAARWTNGPGRCLNGAGTWTGADRQFHNM